MAATYVHHDRHLRVLREAECERRRKRVDPCCYDHAPLDRAIEQLRDRLKK